MLVELFLEGRTVRFNRTHQSIWKQSFHSRDRGVVQVIWREAVGRLGVSDCYLSGAQTNHQVGDEGVFCFSWAVAHHHTPAVLLGQLTPKGVKPGWRLLKRMQAHWLHLTSVHIMLWCPQSVISVLLMAVSTSTASHLGNSAHLGPVRWCYLGTSSHSHSLPLVQDSPCQRPVWFLLNVQVSFKCSKKYHVNLNESTLLTFINAPTLIIISLQVCRSFFLITYLASYPKFPVRDRAIYGMYGAHALTLRSKPVVCRLHQRCDGEQKCCWTDKDVKEKFACS